MVEEPLTIELDDVTVTTTMRTPGHDFELAAGFCFTEGLLGAASITAIRYCAARPAADTEFNLVTVQTDGAPPAVPRLGLTTSACGLCGAESIEALSELCEAVAGFADRHGHGGGLAGVLAEVNGCRRRRVFCGSLASGEPP